jgi:DNA-binding Lrp family transcriptional regulator
MTKPASPVVMDYSCLSNLIDDLDMQIIEILSKDAKISIIEIAKLAGCNDKTVLYRIKKLQKEKVILRYGIELNPEKFSLEAYHLFWEFYNMDIQMSNRFRKYLSDMNETTYISETIGSVSSFESDILVANSTELYETVNDLKETFPDLIKGFEPMIILKVHKAF